MAELLLIVTMAGERVAVAASEVESVVEIDEVTAVPRAAGHIAGLAALRSRVLTVIDCRAALGIGGAPRSPSDAIVAQLDGHPYALLVDGVEDVFEYDGEVLPIRSALSKGWRRVAKGFVETSQDALLLVDIAALLVGPAAKAA
jgi:purine-binding chemotaxis protein CheW